MPYIKPEERAFLDPAVTVLARRLAEHTADMEKADCTGRLNYVVTTLLIKYVKIRFGKFRYAVGVLRNTLCDVREEFYRRVVGPYEDKKTEENGDVGFDDLLD